MAREGLGLSDVGEVTLGMPPLRDSGKADEVVLESPGLEALGFVVSECAGPLPQGTTIFLGGA